jgi:hypothetical protein
VWRRLDQGMPLALCDTGELYSEHEGALLVVTRRGLVCDSDPDLGGLESW